MRNRMQAARLCHLFGVKDLEEDLRTTQITRPSPDPAGAKFAAELAARLGGNTDRRAAARRDQNGFYFKTCRTFFIKPVEDLPGAERLLADPGEIIG